MCSKKSSSYTSSKVLGFSYPKLHQGNTWYVDFYAYDPATGTMRRKKYMLDKIEKVTERRRRASELMNELLRQLRGGWNPWVSTDSSRGYTLLEECLAHYLNHVAKMDRAKTIHSYTSRVNVLREFIGTMLIPIKYVYQYDSVFVNDFLDWVHLDRDSSATTRNNYRGWCYAFAEYLISRKYISSNPVEGIPNLKQEKKKRLDLSKEQLKTLRARLSVESPNFLLACLMEYFTFIRPTELSFIRIKDISIKNQCVFISGSVSKNHKDANVGLNDTLIKLMIDLKVFDNPSDYYLFGKGFAPSKNRVGPDQFNKRWHKLRDALGWSDAYQFYSLKDSGIRDLANSEGVVIARDQARHSDVSTTNKYLQGANSVVHESTKHFKGFIDDD